MAAVAEELYSLLVPLHKGRLIVPRSCITEVVRFVPPERPDPTAPEWFRGFVSWGGRRVPVARVEGLCGLTGTEPGGRTRLAIFNSLSNSLGSGVFGILTEGFPQLVRVNRDVMELHDEQNWSDDSPVICQIRMINEYPLILDLEKLESMLQEQIAATLTG